MADQRNRAELLPAVSNLRVARGGANWQMVYEPRWCVQFTERGAAFNDGFSHRINYTNQFVMAAVEKRADREFNGDGVGLALAERKRESRGVVHVFQRKL